MAEFKRPKSGSERALWENIERLIFRDRNILKSSLKNEMPWGIDIKKPGFSFSNSGDYGNSTLDTKPSDELVLAIQRYIHREDFNARFYFQGHKLERIITF